MVGAFIVWAYEHGYELTLGETLAYGRRSWAATRLEPAHALALHDLRLAIDVSLFIGGEWQESAAAFTPLGEWWEAHGGTWGGRFNPPHPRHFSLAYDASAPR